MELTSKKALELIEEGRKEDPNINWIHFEPSLLKIINTQYMRKSSIYVI